MDYCIKDFQSLFQSKEVQAKDLIDNPNLSIEYYHLYQKNSLYVDTKSINSDVSLYYFILKGSAEFLFNKEKVKLFSNQLLEVHNQPSFDIYALEETKLLFISSTASNIDTKLDELAAQIKEEEARDPYTQGHNYRVGKYANIIMHHLDPTYTSNDLAFAGSYHDIGKLKVDMEVLNKRGRLTDEEWKQIQMHPVYSYEILKPILGERIAFIAKCHHEKLDGSGYPSHLKGKKIPLESQILAVVDIFDALTSKRAYHNSLSSLEALAIIDKDVEDKKLNPEAVRVLRKMVQLGIINPDDEL